MGPFEGKSPLEKAHAVARALMGVGPDALDLSVQVDLDLAAYAAEHGPLAGHWIRIRQRGVPDFFVRGSLVEGLRSASLPAGESAAVAIDAGGSRVVTAWLAAFADAFGRGLFGAPDPLEVARLQGTLDACRPDFHQRMFRGFWLMLRQDLSPAEARDPRVVASPPNLRDQLYRHLLNLRSLYRDYMVTARLFGCFAAVNDIGDATARPAGEDGSVWPAKLAYLAAGPWEEPRDLLRAAVSVTAEDGMLDRLLALGEQWRDDLDNAITAARDADDGQTAIEILYEKAPKAWAALTLYAVLGDAPASLASDRDRAAWRRVAKLVDEKRTRVRHALTHSVLDLSGARWRTYRRELATLRATDGDAAATKTAHRYVDEHLLYPRALLPQLLAEESDGAAPAGPAFPPIPLDQSGRD